jgi:LuxR family transcriptional regulator, maltose regulon positive regulatory protein
VDEGPPLARLLRRMQEQGGRIHPYLHTLLAAFARQADLQPASVTPPPSEEPLSEREREVLRLIAEGLSNQQLAARLYLSPHTIKVHTRNIYGKLDVTSRTQAVAKARALGILDRP